MAEGDPGLKPILLHTAQLAIPVIALGEYATEYRSLGIEHGTSNG